MFMELRNYRCSCCGHEKKISTNHKTSCWSYCEDCSWKGLYFDPINQSSYLFGCVHRRFDYLSEIQTERMENS